MAHPGKERRRRFVYITRNTEYHVQDGVCVAIRNRRNGHWLESHGALERPVEGGVRMYPNGAAIPTMKPPELGAPMYFHADDDGEEQIITSTLEAVGRPEKTDLRRYPAA